jgi:hypothetical protein
VQSGSICCIFRRFRSIGLESRKMWQSSNNNFNELIGKLPAVPTRTAGQTTRHKKAPRNMRALLCRGAPSKRWVRAMCCPLHPLSRCCSQRMAACPRAARPRMAARAPRPARRKPPHGALNLPRGRLTSDSARTPHESGSIDAAGNQSGFGASVAHRRLRERVAQAAPPAPRANYRTTIAWNWVRRVDARGRD